ncbi:PilX N-terminal domain-containing pilus assembly protein [Candidatus Halobeggiatoa sp. HSG11]|nr:PilX N-terminal domain-containing pilus assembly protein [Candidatus Halobeggiatoa sp. HSG11]
MKINHIQQQGAVLLMSLVLLIVLTLLGISALDSTKLETRMAANIQEDHTAFQAANAGIDQAYHHYVFKGIENDFENLQDFPKDEWSVTEPVISEHLTTAGLQFDNDAAASLRVKKVVIPETSKNFFIIESTGRTGCVNGKNCTGHQVQLVEGWSFKGATGTGEQSDELQRCLNASVPTCQTFFTNFNDCVNDSSCTPLDTVPGDCGETEDGIALPTYCAKIFSNIVNGVSE